MCVYKRKLAKCPEKKSYICEIGKFGGHICCTLQNTCRIYSYTFIHFFKKDNKQVGLFKINFEHTEPTSFKSFTSQYLEGLIFFKPC